MITAVDTYEHERYARELDEMFRARASVFRDRLGWEVDVAAGRERDRYDDARPLYLLSIAEGGEVRGSLRLLPTTGSHMMRDVFACFFRQEVLIESPTVWECTRFCVHPGYEALSAPSGVGLVSLELLIGLCDLALCNGISQITGVFEAPMQRIYGRIGWRPEVIGRSDRAGRTPVRAGLWDVSEQALANMRSRALEPRPSRRGAGEAPCNKVA